MTSHQSIGQALVSPESLISSAESAAESAAANDWLRIEQPAWNDPTADGFYEWVVSSGKELDFDTVSETLAEYNSHCEEDGSLTVEIQIHRSRDDLNYAISASYGELSGTYVHNSSTKKSVTVSKATSIDLKVQVAGSVSASWEGAVYGTDNSVVSPPPAITADGSVLSWGDEKVSGVLRLSYESGYDAYTLTIIPRDSSEYESDDPNGAYQSTVFAVWEGGAPSHEVNLPDMSGYCNGGSSLKVNPDDEDTDTCYDLYVKRHKCTNKLISQELKSVACPEARSEEQEREIAESEGS
jgi:hypothetical protein